MPGFVENTLMAATPQVLGLEAVDELPDADPASTVRFLSMWWEKGIPEFRLLVVFSCLALNLYSLIVKRRVFTRLDPSDRSDVMERIFRSRSPVALAISQFVSMAAIYGYFSRADVLKLLGFDIVALKEESELRRVTRDGELPPRSPEGAREAGEAVTSLRSGPGIPVAEAEDAPRDVPRDEEGPEERQ